MSKFSRNLILFGAVALLILGAVIYSIFHGRATVIPDGTVGNTPGNLNNNGLFTERDGIVYFSNPYDNNSLYSMTANGENLTKLIDMTVEYINAGGNYVFFYGKPNKTTTGIGSVVSKPGMYRIEKNGDNLKALSKDVTRSMILYGNNIYFQHYTESTGTTFDVYDLKKNESRTLLDKMINPAGLYGGSIYYNGMYEDHYLYCYDIATETEIPIWEGDIWNPIYDGNYVYYMDVLNNYRLCRYSIPDNTIEVLTNERLDSFNLYGDIIFYQVSSSKSPALKRMNNDGSNPITIAEGVYKGINITSTYTYFTEFGTDYPLYRVPTYTSDPYPEEFTAARDVLVQNLKK